MMDAKGFGEVLKELRTRRKLSRSRVAQQLSIHPSTLEKWERGDVLPDRSRVEELIRALKLVESEELLLREAHAGYRILPTLHNLPAPQNPYFTGRETILARLYDRLAPGKQIILTQVPQAVSGLGGIGKTQVALHYAYYFQKAYSHVLWVTADSREMLATEFVRLAQDLDLPEKDEQDQSKVVRAVQRWLREYLDWLLILDNVEDLELVNTFVPAGYLGTLLLTTRRQVTEPVAQTLELDVFSPEHGALFLLKRTRRLALQGSRDEAEASEIVMAQSISQHLGGLPLALDQAGAYIAENRCSLSHYLDLFKQQQTTLLQRRGTVPSHHPQSVTSTFSLAFEQIQQKNETAIELLKFCAFLAPDAIPLELITQGAVHSGNVLKPVAANVLKLDQALETLQAYSLVGRDEVNNTITMHRLVQVVLQNTLEEAEQLIRVGRLLSVINAAFPDVEHSTWPQCERLLTQAISMAQLIEQYQLVNEGAGNLLYNTARYLKERARYREAEPLYQRALRIREQQSGLDHPQVAYPLNGLADLYFEQGKYSEAEPLYQRALRIWEQQPGPDVAYPLNGLAHLYSEQGKYEEAEPLYQRALRIREQQLGPAHSDVAYPLNNLANLYKSQGKYGEAEPLYQRALRIWEHQLGPDHPQVAYPLNNLGVLYFDQGKYKEAEPLYQRALRIREQQLGPDHPQVAYPLNGLALLYFEQGKYKEAEPLYQRALRIREQQLGPAHPDVAYPLNNLAILYLEQGEYEKAEPLYQRALRIWEHQLGPDHSQVAYPLNNLGVLCFEQGKYGEAEPLYQRALRIWERQLGPDHPNVAHPLNNLANLYREQGKYTEAERLYQRALHIREQAQGREHPDIAETNHDLAQLREVQGNSEDAKVLYTRALTVREQALGVQHTKTTQTRTRLIALLHATGQHEQAVQLETTQTE